MSSSTQQRSIQERVNEICSELYANGTKPTVRMVLSMLPDISSTSTVHKYFGNWKEELKANQQSLYAKLGFSSEFTQSFMKEITRFSVEAEQRYKEESQDAKDQRDIAIEELGSAEERLSKQEAVVKTLRDEVAELQNELKTVNVEHKANIAKEQGTNAAIVTELRQQLERESKASDELSKSNETLRTEVATLRLKLEGNQQYVDEVKEQNKGLVEENKSLNKEIGVLVKANASQESTITGDEKLIANLESALKEGQKLTSNIENESVALKSEAQKIRSELEEKTKLSVQLTENLERSISTIAELKKTVNEQSTVIAKLTQ